jgi:hypothetical protein
MRVDDIRFYNFNTKPDREGLFKFPNRRCVAYDPCWGSDPFDCGITTWMSNVTWHETTRRLVWAWDHEALIYDMDGSFYNTDLSYSAKQGQYFKKNLALHKYFVIPYII